MSPSASWSLVLSMIVGTLACADPVLVDEDGSGGSESGADDTTEGDTDEGVPSCEPSAGQPCGDGLLCCSDDPLAIDLAALDQLVTPQYQGGGGVGTPVFSGANNSLSRWGTCVDPNDPPSSKTLTDVGVQGCPIPCNPTWTSAEITQVCGAASQCCQTRPIEPIDCVLDPTIGDGCWRPVTGNDITGFGGVDATQWTNNQHATHQDPSGANCKQFVDGIPPAVLVRLGVTASDVQRECFRRLDVADQRGYCMDASATCAIDPATPDACQLRNEQELRTDCAELLP